MQLLLLALSVLAASAKKTKDPKDCELCVKILGSISDNLSKDDRQDIVAIETAISTYCKNKKLSQNDKKVASVPRGSAGVRHAVSAAAAARAGAGGLPPAR